MRVFILLGGSSLAFCHQHPELGEHVLGRVCQCPRASQGLPVPVLPFPQWHCHPSCPLLSPRYFPLCCQDVHLSRESSAPCPTPRELGVQKCVRLYTSAQKGRRGLRWKAWLPINSFPLLFTLINGCGIHGYFNNKRNLGALALIALDNRFGQTKNESPAMIIVSVLTSPASLLPAPRFALLQ